MLLFADDLKIYKVIASQEDHLKLQTDLNTLVKWSQTNDLPFNFKKCKCLRFSKKKQHNNFKYYMNGNELPLIDNHKDLGIWFNSKLVFNNHIQNIAKEAYKMLGFVFRLSHEFKNEETLMLLYTSLVRSKLEYASVVWAPHCQKYVNIIEAVQKKFTRYLDFKTTGIYPIFDHYNDLIQLYSIDSLDDRRRKASLIFLYKIFNNVIDTSGLIHHFSIYVPSVVTRPKPTFFRIPKCRTDCYANSPFLRIMRLYNKVSANADMFCQSLNEFLSSILIH